MSEWELGGEPGSMREGEHLHRAYCCVLVNNVTGLEERQGRKRSLWRLASAERCARGVQ